MARRKANWCTCSKRVTVEGDSTEHVDQETNQEMHEDSTQSMGLQLDIKFAIILHKNSIKKKTKYKHGLSLLICSIKELVLSL